MIEQKHWRVKARMTVSDPNNNETLILDWTTQAENFDLRLSYGLFGVNAGELSKKGER